jgi:ATP-dependent helicase HrpB
VLHLPIDDILPDLCAALKAGSNALVCAPPGSGKTTRVPPALLEHIDGKVILLQPRRIAVRSSARRIAQESGCKLGDRVGYRVRFESKVSAKTRLEVMTEGLLTRLIQGDPFLEGVGAVVMDEFHERSLDSDLLLALLREIQKEARPDLKIVVMSATLDSEPVQDFLGGAEDCPLFQAQGQAFPVEVIYKAPNTDISLEVAAAQAVRQALKRDPSGDVLVFLPGRWEIEQTAGFLSAGLPENVQVLPLHGSLRSEEQDRVLQPSTQTKVVLATNIAETSLTLPGVRTVIDTGLVRQARFDPRLGVDRLVTRPSSQASTIQRAGRAGRTQAGQCVRLWTQHAQSNREPFEQPAIHQSDLAPALLQILAWGSTPNQFQWFERPPQTAIETAETLLQSLGAFQADGQGLSNVGQQLARFPTHPRLGRVVIEGARLGVLHQAVSAAALASERDPWAHTGGPSDLLDRINALDSGRRGDRRLLQQVRKVRDQLTRLSKSLPQPSKPSPTGDLENRVLLSLVAGFPDRVGMRRDTGKRRCLLSSGIGADLAHGVHAETYFVAVVLTAGDRGRAPQIRAIAPLDPQCLNLEWRLEALFDPEKEAVVCQKVKRFGAVCFASKLATNQGDPHAITESLSQHAALHFDRLFPFSGDDGRLIRRLRFVARVRPDLSLPDWLQEPQSLLAEWCEGKSTFAQLKKMNLAKDLLERLPWPTQKVLGELAPDRMTLPGGSSVRLLYPENQAPVLAARIQKLFGLKSTPTLGGVPLTIHLLAPNGRPAQITQDLSGFWAGSYKDVRKALRGRYPKHAWPEDPTQV